MAGRRDGRGRAIGYINVDIRWEPRSPKLRQPRSPVDHRAPEPNPYLPVLLVQEDALAHLARPQTTDFSESLSAVIILTDTKGPPPPPPPPKMPINHVGVAVPETQLEETVQFYLRALGPLGYVEMVRPVPGVVGLGAKGVADLWLSALLSDVTNSKIHLAFDAESEDFLPPLTHPAFFVWTTPS